MEDKWGGGDSKLFGQMRRLSKLGRVWTILEGGEKLGEIFLERRVGPGLAGGGGLGSWGDLRQT
jgi:hypothetical protein